ncbi:MAG: hypothetical protein IJC36_01755, partial [Clostridia bacterium]|nr:hypothetical protein [Clostridia bacterium]
YFITICTKDRKRILSKIVGEGSPLPKLTLHGEIIQKYILSIPQKYPNVNFDKYVIMPNHIHIILCIKMAGGETPPLLANAKKKKPEVYNQTSKESKTSAIS